MDKKKIVLATQNNHKYKEIVALWEHLPFQILSLTHFSTLSVAEETGTTFKENALLKAWAISKQTTLPAVADDSGFCVSALEERPGIFSARYAGVGASDEQNLQKVLQEYLSSPLKNKNRKCKFVCAAAWVDAQQNSQWVCESEVCGLMLEQPLGQQGFGYDPLFYYEPLQKSFAQLTLEEKNNYSHRSKAFAELGNYLKLKYDERM